ncbi:MAG TPA: hypothetical protein VFU53_11690, partial [Burkholderiales bacterium]|nr:hypothetical protein [Burkholderiales bacterium]
LQGKTILDGQEYDFSADANGLDIVGSEDSVVNDNIFKKIKGVGGLFQSDGDGLAPWDENPLQGQKVVVKDSAGNTAGTATTDADGWWYTEFLATGKASTYKAYWDQDGDGNVVGDGDPFKTTSLGGSAGKWAQVDFTVVDPVGYDPSALPTPDYQIDGYDGIL